MDKIEQIFCEVFQLNVNQLNDTANMDSVDLWDSLTHMDLISSIESELDIELTMDEIMQMKSLNTVRYIVNKKIGN